MSLLLYLKMLKWETMSITPFKKEYTIPPIIYFNFNLLYNSVICRFDLTLEDSIRHRSMKKIDFSKPYWFTTILMTHSLGLTLYTWSSVNWKYILAYTMMIFYAKGLRTIYSQFYFFLMKKELMSKIIPQEYDLYTLIRNRISYLKWS